MYSGDQFFSRDRQLDLWEMSGDILGTHFGGVDSNQVKSSLSRTVPVFSGWFFQFILGFLVFWVIWMNLYLQPLVSTSHSGLLIQMKGVLQGISGGALWVVR